MQAQAGVQLCHKERWRIPLVLGKLAKNKPLSDTDSKIWSAVSSNLKTQQDIDAITKVTLRIVTPPRSITPTRSGSRTPNRARSNGPTPNRSPCITPRLTPRSRADSQRLFTGTISSQNRALSFAEEDAPTSPLPRKLSKRASSKSGHKAPKHKGSKARSPNSIINSGMGIGSPSEDTLGDGIAAFESEKAASLVEQVTSRIVNFTATISAKLGGGGENTTKGGETSTINCTENVYNELSEQCRDLQNGAYGANASTDTGEEAAPVGVTGDGNIRVKPSKRRSFFGSLLASFTGQSQDDHAGAADPTEEQPVSPTLSHKQASSQKRSSADAGFGSGSGSGSGSGRTEGMSFGAALAAWFPWSHSAPVVPLDLTERDPIEQSVH